MECNCFVDISALSLEDVDSVSQVGGRGPVMLPPWTHMQTGKNDRILQQPIKSLEKLFFFHRLLFLSYDMCAYITCLSGLVTEFPSLICVRFVFRVVLHRINRRLV